MVKPIVATAIVVIAISMGACSPSGSVPSSISVEGPWASEIEVAYTRSNNNFIRQILADGIITDAEFSEARSRVKDCMAEAGFEGWWQQGQLGDWSWTIDGRGSAAHDEASGRCFSMWLGDIHWLYQDMRFNPNNEEMSPLIAQCLVRNGLVPEGFTGHDWDEFERANLFDYGEGCYPDPEREGAVICPATMNVNSLLPGGVDANSPEALKCRWAPLLDL